jgi:hypothetical protein
MAVSLKWRKLWDLTEKLKFCENEQSDPMCDCLVWENPAKVARQNLEKGKKKVFFFSKDASLIYFIHPKVQKYIQKCRKFHLMSLKLIVFQYNSFIQTSKISKNNFFPSFPRPTHKIFEML